MHMQHDRRSRAHQTPKPGRRLPRREAMRRQAETALAVAESLTAADRAQVPA